MQVRFCAVRALVLAALGLGCSATALADVHLSFMLRHGEKIDGGVSSEA